MTQARAIALYSKPDCVQCVATKRRLDRLGLEYTEVDMAQDPAALEYVRGLGYQQAPVVVLDDDTHWSGNRPDLIDKIGA